MRSLLLATLALASWACTPAPSPEVVVEPLAEVALDIQPSELEGFWYEVAHTQTKALLDQCEDTRMAFEFENPGDEVATTTLECRHGRLWYSIVGTLTPGEEPGEFVLQLDGRSPVFGPHHLHVVAEGPDWLAVHHRENDWTWIVSRWSDVDLQDVHDALTPLVEDGFLTEDVLDPGLIPTQHTWIE